MISHGINATNIYQKLLEAGEDYADKDAAATMYEESKKVLLAQLMLKSPATSQSGKETDALADPSYSVHIGRMVEARKEANRAKIKWISSQAWVDAKRTEAATERQAMRQGG